MRERVKARIWKSLRRSQGRDVLLRSAVEQKIKSGISLVNALQAVVLDAALMPPERAAAARLLPNAFRKHCLITLARRFAEHAERDDVMPIANVFRFLKDPVGVPFFITALTDPDPQKRYAAAYGLGIPHPGRRAVDSLIRVVADANETPRV